MNYTIYIASDLDKDDKFYGEENKSGLVNELLRKHYGMGGAVNIKQNKDGTISPRRVGKTASLESKTKQEVEQIVEPITYKKTGNWGA